MSRKFTIERDTGSVDVIVYNDGDFNKYGTKHRVSKRFIEFLLDKRRREDPDLPEIEEIVYAGPSKAGGAYALAVGAEECGIRSRLFLSGKELPPHAQDLPKSVTVHLMRASLAGVTHSANKHIKRRFGKAVLIPFGADDPDYCNMLYEDIVDDPTVQPLIEMKPKRIWMAVGSGALLSVFMRIFPETYFHAVQVGKKLKPELRSHPRVTTYWAPERFNHDATTQPPYKCVTNYDAKVWQFLLTKAEEGDVVWTVL